MPRLGPVWQVCVVLLCLLPCRVLWAQDAPLLLPPDAGTTSLTVCVNDGEGQVASADVAVSIAGPQLPAGQSSKTDAFGCAAFAGLQPGRYRITAGGLGSGFLRGRDDVETSSTGAKHTLTLTRAASLEGKVEDQDGKPVAGARISAVVEGFVHGRPSKIDFRGRRSDEAGRFEVGDLVPGVAFLLLAEPPTIRLQEVDYASAAQPARKETVRATPAWAPVYHPNAAARSSALAITLQPGPQAPSAPLVMNKRDGYCVRGFAEAADLPEDARLSVVLQRPQPLGQSVFAGGSTSPGKGFEACGLTAGTYKLLVWSGRGAQARFATRQVVVSDRHELLGGIVLSGSRQVKGQFFCGEDACAPEQLGAMVVRFTPAERIGIGDTGTVKPDAKGWFFSPALFDDDYVVDVHGLPDTACVEAIRSGSRDVTRTAWNPAEGDLTVQLRMECGQIRGRVEGRNVERLVHRTVVVTREGYPEAGPGEVQAAAADEDGNYAIGGLPPGKYRVCLETRFSPAYALSFAAIESCRAKGKDVCVGARSTELLTLRTD